MFFDPAKPLAERWTFHDKMGACGGRAETWHAILDPVRDTLTKACDNQRMGTYDIKTKAWSLASHSTAVERSGWAVDLHQRAIYMVDPYKGQLHRWALDARSLTTVGALPTGPIAARVIGDKGYLAFDSDQRALVYQAYEEPGTWVWPVDRPYAWTRLDAVAPGTPASALRWNTATYDATNRLVVALGGAYIWLLKLDVSTLPGLR